MTDQFIETIEPCEPHDQQLTIDEVFELLENSRRRQLLYYLKNSSEKPTLKEIASQIAAYENKVSIDALESKQQKTVYVSLYQTHIPKLEAADVIEFDDASNTVRLLQAEQLFNHLFLHNSKATSNLERDTSSDDEKLGILRRLRFQF